MILWKHRDLQIVRYVADGLTYKRVAIHYGISPVRVQQICVRWIQYAMRPLARDGRWTPAAWLRSHRGAVYLEVSNKTARIFAAQRQGGGS